MLYSLSTVLSLFVWSNVGFQQRCIFRAAMFDKSVSFPDLLSTPITFSCTQGLETNGIYWNTAIRCNNNNGSFIFNPALHHYELKSDHVVYKINTSKIFWSVWFLMKIFAKGVISINYISEASWVMTISDNRGPSDQTITVIKWNIKSFVISKLLNISSYLSVWK